MKPSNILVNCQDTHVKLCDFGLSKWIENGENEEDTEQKTENENDDSKLTEDMDDEIDDNLSTLTEYVVTRYYRAPEILLNCAKANASSGHDGNYGFKGKTIVYFFGRLHVRKKNKKKQT